MEKLNEADLLLVRVTIETTLSAKKKEVEDLMKRKGNKHVLEIDMLNLEIRDLANVLAKLSEESVQPTEPDKEKVYLITTEDMYEGTTVDVPLCYFNDINEAKAFVEKYTRREGYDEYNYDYDELEKGSLDREHY